MKAKQLIESLEKLTNKKVNLFEKLSAEDMLTKKKTQFQLTDIGDKETVADWIDRFHVKTVNYKPNTYYRVEGSSGSGYGGIGNGLYLSRDESAVSNFYDIEQEGLPISEYYGNPKWLDLMDHSKFENFKKMLSKKGIEIVNSNEVGNIVKDLGYDGIRYYDVLATGEEFVLFNSKALKKIK